jgi:recombination protein RecA
MAIEAIEKAQGKGALMVGSGSLPDVNFFSSGCVSVDEVLGGGWARGRIHEVMGPESSGKTTLLLHAIAEIQKLGGTAAFVDAEHALSMDYAVKLGVDSEKLLVAQPDNAEQALDIVETLISSGAVDLVIVDSVAALVPSAEVEGGMGDSHMGLQARLMGQAMRKLAGKVARTGTTLIFINQIRMKIGVMFGSPETTTGGNALKFYSSQRVDIRRIGGVKDGEELVANATRVKCVKNKVAPPFRECEIEIRFGEGLDVMADLLNRAVAKEIVEKSGAWYSFKEQRIGQGVAQSRQWLIEHPDQAEIIREATISKV